MAGRDQIRPDGDRLGCGQVRRMLQAFLDGELASAQGELVAAHLESCTRCRIESDVLSRVIASLRRLRPDLDLEAYTRLTEVVDRLGRTTRLDERPPTTRDPSDDPT